jgi:hypothetical protein
MAAVAGLFLLPAALFHLELASAQVASKADPPERHSRATTRFTGTMSLPSSGGHTIPMRVVLKEWDVVREAGGFELPEQGFYIVHLYNGDIITKIDGKSETRHPGDFWTVSKGARMVIELVERRGGQAMLRSRSIHQIDGFTQHGASTRLRVANRAHRSSGAR